MKKVLFIDTTHPVLRDELIKMGFECVSFPGMQTEKLLNIVPEYTGIIIRSKFIIDKEILDHANQLKFIGRLGSGMENIDVDYAESKGIICLNSPEGSRDAVGEHTLALLLCLFNKVNSADAEVRQGKWFREANRGLEIKNKTIGLVGYGNMGSAFAEKLQGFGARVIAYDKYKFGFGNNFIEEVNPDQIFNSADILSLHVPLTEETHYMVNDEYLKQFRNNIFLINTSRGSVVQTADLVKNIKKGKVLGAALDVLEYEMSSFENLNPENLPEAFHFLTTSEKVVLTPHIAGWTVESKFKLAKVLAEKIREAMHIG